MPLSWPPLRDAPPSAEDRLPKSLCFAESDVIIFVVRASGVHETRLWAQMGLGSVTGRGQRR